MQNGTPNASIECFNSDNLRTQLVVIDGLTFALGQPVVFKLLWHSFTSRRRPVDLLSCNLALFNNVHYLLSLVHLAILFTRWELQYKLLNILLVFVEVGGPSSLCFISVERYVAVIHPTSFPLLKRYRWREGSAACLWLCTVIAVILVGLNHETLPLWGEGTTQIISLWVMTTMMVILLWCSVHIAQALRQAGPGRDKLHPQKKRAFITVSATTTILLLFYIPVAVMQIKSYSDEPFRKCTIVPISILLLSAANVVHPLFYLHTQGALCRCSWRNIRDP